ncbi:MAG: InlB B-repeat-containing protein [Lachnospiraceae bacterium]|nr:InlB B-repeat-containing protein [Lachnospiraceae bacterium]
MPSTFYNYGYRSVYTIFESGNEGNVPIDLNEDEGGEYLFLGQKLQDTFSKNGVTGVILLEDSGTPAPFTYDGKDYYPIPADNLLNGASGDLNDGAGGTYCYLYYTTDGADKGEPVLKKLNTVYTKNLDWEGYVKSVTKTDDNIITTYYGDVAPNGYHIYLYQTYHTHNNEKKYDDNGHWDACKQCAYISETEPHEFTYIPVGYGSSHKAVCDCGYECMQDHVDADGDNKCDLCLAELVAETGGLYYESFERAWRYAVGQERDMTITVLQDAVVNGKLDTLYNGHTVTVTSANGENAPVIELENSGFFIGDGTLVLNADVKYSGTELDNVFRVSGENAGLCIKSGNISAEYTDKSGDETIIKADNNSAVVIEGGNITGAATIISASGCRKVEITGGTFSGDACALSLEKVSSAAVKGGTFRSSDFCSIKVDNSSCVKDIFPAGYHCYVEDTGEMLVISNDDTIIAENVTVRAFNINIIVEGNGTASCEPAAVGLGEIVKLVQERVLGNHFVEWQTSDVVISENNTFVMPEKDISIKAVFEENELISYIDENGETKSTTLYDEFTPDMTFVSSGWYFVEDTITISDRIEITGDVHLILADGCEFTAEKGILVPEGKSLTVYGQSTGKQVGILSATDEYSNAAIGGNQYENSGVITINGGSIRAVASYGAGIGGGGGSELEHGGTGTVVINGGKVEGMSDYGAGIGGGYNVGKGVVTINGGEVGGMCTMQGAGIGGGGYLGSADVTINGGTVKAIGLSNASGLGGADVGTAGKITITGGKVDAYSVGEGTEGICAGIFGFIKLVPCNKYSLEVKTDDITEISGSPFGSEDDITDELKGEYEAHIKEVPKPTYAVTVTTGGYGTAEADVERAYAGDTVTLSAQPDPFFHFGSWQSEDVTVSEDGTFIMPAQAVTVKAEFELCTNSETVVGQPATCLKDGYKSCYKCSCGKFFENKECTILIPDYLKWIKEGSGKIPASGHEYGTPEYVWDGNQCTATRVCSACEEGTEGHSQTETQTGKYVKDTEATCEKAETGHYVVEKFNNPNFSAQQTEKDSVVNGDPRGHDYVVEQYNANQHRYVCQNDENHTYLEDHVFEGDTCTVCNYVQGHSYIIIYGAGSEWTKGNSEGCLITSDAPYAKFEDVKVDGSLIEEADYSVQEGSTEVTLKAEYLETLSLGKHSIEIISSDGSASTYFTIKPADIPPAPGKYIVTFNMNGHGVQIPAQTVTEGLSVIKPENPEADGYTFKGWYSDSELKSAFDFDTEVNADITLYAKWEKNGEEPIVPGTGDDNSMILWIIIAVAGGTLLAVTIFIKKKKII